MVVVVVGVPVVVISPVFLLSNKLPQTVYILFPLNGPDEDQQESHRKGDSTYCSFVGGWGTVEFLKWSVLKGKRQWCQPPRTALHFNHDDGDGDGDQGCINCGILLSGLRARGVSSEHV